MELQTIQNKIHEIRGMKVMLDFDLAEMYGTETAQLKRAVRRNIERFEGDDFMFELTKEELSRCQFGILNKGRGSIRNKPPELKRVRRITSFWGNDLAIVLIAAVCIALLVRVTLLREQR